MKALILAGGKGTRLAEHTQLVPKPMIDIGGKPLLEHQIALLSKYGFTDIVLLVNHLKESIVSHFGDGTRHGVSINYFIENEPLGTVGGVKELEPHLTADFIVMYGDVMVNMDLGRLVAFHRSKGSECTVVVHPNDHPYDSDLVDMDDTNRIIAFHPKPHDAGGYYRNLVNAGLYVMSPSILQWIERGAKADFGKDIFPSIFSQTRMFGYNTAEYLKDMGTPDRLARVRADFETGRISRANRQAGRRAIFLDRDGVLNHDLNLISKPEDLHLFDHTPSAVKRINQSEYLAVVVTNQSVVARNLCTIDQLKLIHNKLETELGSYRAYLDAIYFCPHHPDRGYPGENPEYKIECECRKPKPGMLLQAANDFNIDLSRSWIIGDSYRDIEAGRAAGCRTIALRSGEGTRNCSPPPDFWFEDLADAVDFIVDEPYLAEALSILEEVDRSGKRPFIVSVAGRARSGKTNFCRYLIKKLEEKSIPALHVELDQWLVAENNRTGCKTVFDRYRADTLRKDIASLSRGNTVTAPGYKAETSGPGNPIIYNPSGFDVIIIDGVLSLAFLEVNELSDLKIFINIDPELHKKRVFDYYRWKGKSNEEVESLYRERLIDEYQLIDIHAKNADRLISSTKKSSQT